ncbi:MAG: hypothetical protein J7483_06245 [Novosphingobium sp.]|nr:hypothetical protein [Novosphingobium sp.]
MVYFERPLLQDDVSAGAGAVSFRRPAPALTAIERHAVMVSRADPLSSVRAPSRLDRLVHAVIGLKRVPGLADARLEALRRYAVLYRIQGDRIDAAELARATDGGLDGHALAQVRRIVDGWNIGRHTRLEVAVRVGFVVALLVVALVGASQLTALFRNGIVAWLVIGALAVTLAPALGGTRRPVAQQH